MPRPHGKNSLLQRSQEIASPMNNDSTRLTDANLMQLDADYEQNLRPNRLEQYIGQQHVHDQLLISIQAAKLRSEAIDHVLLHGPPGLGKTTLARIIAAEMNQQFHSTSGPVLEKGRDIAALLSALGSGDILFIDEIHRLNPVIEEILYSAMEDFQIDLILGEGPTARTMKMPLKKFTLIGATTRSGLLTAPLLARFGISLRLEFYQISELSKIVERSARVLNTTIEAAAALEIARRARGTPRIANRLLRRVRDYAEVNQQASINLESVNKSLQLLQIDHNGLDEMDRKFLGALIETYTGGPAGVEALAAAIGEERGTLEDVVEPFLLQQGFLQRTPRGRVATNKAYKHLGLPVPKSQPQPQRLD